jgi:hypothetical protein
MVSTPPLSTMASQCLPVAYPPAPGPHGSIGVLRNGQAVLSRISRVLDLSCVLADTCAIIGLISGYNEAEIPRHPGSACYPCVYHFTEREV